MSKGATFIGDVHGKSGWLSIAKKALMNFRKVIFLGDYLDSFDISPVEQKKNLLEIIEFAKDHPEDVDLLLGNHDYAYIFALWSISGYQFAHAHEYRAILEENKDLFKIAWGYRNESGKYTLATHAGITKSFWKGLTREVFHKDGFMNRIGDPRTAKDMEPHEILNLVKDQKELLWVVGSMRGGYGTPGPLWADYRELLYDPLPKVNQIFGHTARGSVSIEWKSGNFYACVDTMDERPPSLTISL